MYVKNGLDVIDKFMTTHPIGMGLSLLAFALVLVLHLYAYYLLYCQITGWLMQKVAQQAEHRA